MPDDLDSQEQVESKAETEPSQEPHAGRSSGKAESLLDLFNPFEALCEPELFVVALVIVAAAVAIGLIGLIGWVLWTGAQEVFQEVFLGGGPPQGLGLK